MSGTMSTPATGVGTDYAAPTARTLGWRPLQLVAAALVVVSFVIPMVVAGRFEGFLASMAAPFVIGLVLARFLPRTGAIFLGVVSLLILAFSAPFLADALLHPESAVDFIPLVLLVIGAVVGAVAAVPAYREIRGSAEPSGMPRTVALVSGIVLVVAAAVSTVAALGVESVSAQPGDVTMTMRDFSFAPAKITADAGTVAVHLTNDDTTRHTFTIDGVTDVSVGSGATNRVTFDAAPGTYRFYCTPHSPDMQGTLVVD
jgi:plastocyanin